jgi:tRNA uridine 5-carboxymethylaminomethyl modification enzyme
VRPTRETLAHLEPWGSGSLQGPVTLGNLLCRKELDWTALAPWLPAELDLDDDDRAELTTEVRYAGYVVREQVRHARTQRLEAAPMPQELDYTAIGGLTREAVQQLEQVRPRTLAQAARLPGVTAAAVQALSFHLAWRKRTKGAPQAVPEVEPPLP